jgi:hypothetical protein
VKLSSCRFTMRFTPSGCPVSVPVSALRDPLPIHYQTNITPLLSVTALGAKAAEFLAFRHIRADNVLCMGYISPLALHDPFDDAFWHPAVPPLCEPWTAAKPAPGARCIACHGSKWWAPKAVLAPSWRCCSCHPPEHRLVMIDTSH